MGKDLELKQDIWQMSSTMKSHLEATWNGKFQRPLLYLQVFFWYYKKETCLLLITDNETQSAWRFCSTWSQDSCTVYVLINHPNLMNTLTHFSKIMQFWSAKITFQMAIFCSSHRGPRGISSLNHVIVNCNLVRRQCSYYYNVTMS